MKMVAEKTITCKDASFYFLLRDGAFMNSKGERGLSMIQIQHIVELGFHPRNVRRTFQNLIKAKLVEANYFIRVKTDTGKSELMPVKGFDSFQGEGSLGTRSIQFVKYRILEVKGEKKARNTARRKKKHAKKKT